MGKKGLLPLLWSCGVETASKFKGFSGDFFQAKVDKAPAPNIFSSSKKLAPCNVCQPSSPIWRRLVLASTKVASIPPTYGDLNVKMYMQCLLGRMCTCNVFLEECVLAMSSWKNEYMQCLLGRMCTCNVLKECVYAMSSWKNVYMQCLLGRMCRCNVFLEECVHSMSSWKNVYMQCLLGRMCTCNVFLEECVHAMSSWKNVYIQCLLGRMCICNVFLEECVYQYTVCYSHLLQSRFSDFLNIFPFSNCLPVRCGHKQTNKQTKTNKQSQHNTTQHNTTHQNYLYNISIYILGHTNISFIPIQKISEYGRHYIFKILKGNSGLKS